MNKIDEIKQALAAATPGPWTCDETCGDVHSSQTNEIICCPSVNDGKLIAKAPEYIAYLLEENERLRSALETTLFHLKKEYFMSAEDAIEEALAVGQEGEWNHE